MCVMYSYREFCNITKILMMHVRIKNVYLIDLNIKRISNNDWLTVYLP